MIIRCIRKMVLLSHLSGIFSIFHQELRCCKHKKDSLVTPYMPHKSCHHLHSRPIFFFHDTVNQTIKPQCRLTPQSNLVIPCRSSPFRYPTPSSTSSFHTLFRSPIGNLGALQYLACKPLSFALLICARILRTWASVMRPNHNVPIDLPKLTEA